MARRSGHHASSTRTSAGCSTYTYEYAEQDLVELVDPDAVNVLLIEPLGRWADDPLAE